MPSAWIDKLFARLAALYGKHWFDMWADTPMADVKAAWRDSLGAMPGEQIRKGLEHCQRNNTFPPTCPEFVAICKTFAPRFERPALPDHRRAEMPDNVRAEIAKVFDAQRKRDPKDWARQVLAMDAAGQYPHQCGVEMAKRALGLAE